MHIAHLETGRHLYGGPRQVLLLLRELARAGVRNSLICPPASEIASAVDPADAQVHLLPMQGDLDVLFSRRLAHWLAEQSPDLLHVHSRRGADIWGGIAAQRAGVPAVLTRRVDTREIPLLGRLRYRLYDRVVAISACVRDQLLAQGVPRESLDLIHSAIDADACVPQWSRAQFREAFALGPDDLVAVCAAQFIRRKGHRQLIAAWQEVADQFPRARLLLFGRGPAELELEALVRRLQLQASVIFPGFRRDLRAFLGCADLLVHPATEEGLGVVLLEAQAAGLPVVAVDAGGVGEAVAAGETALLVDKDAPAELRQAMLRLLGDPALRAQLGAAGRDRVHAAFAPAGMAQAYLKVYKSVMTATNSTA